MMQFAGYTWLRNEMELLVPPLGMDLAIGTELQDKTINYGRTQLKILAKTKKVGSNIVEHIETAIKYQGVQLSYLTTIFEKIDIDILTRYIKERPKSANRRCIWHLYEWLTGKTLLIEDSLAAYTKLLDDQDWFTLVNGVKHSRTRVINNLLGNQQFCPIIRKTPKLNSLTNLDLMEMAQRHLSDLKPFVDTETLRRSISYLYTKETKSSNKIESEDYLEDKTKKLSRALKSCGILPLNKNRLIFIQNQIVRGKHKDVDYRDQEIYVGTTRPISDRGMTEDIFYIGPKAKHVPSLMQGLLAMHDVLLEDNVLPAMMHTTIVAFGLIYIHPFSDGNGRLHRYLIHDILKTRSPKEQDFIIPVSAAILQHRSQYDRVLETVSKPIMAMTDYDLNEDHSITINNDLHYLYRYPDLTEHVEFLYEMMESAITVDLLEEIFFILKFDSIKQAITDRFDLPNQKLDLMINMLLQGDGAISKSNQQLFSEWLSTEQFHDIESIASKKVQDFDIAKAKAKVMQS